MSYFVSNEASLSLLVLSHLRWDFITQRPQHLFSRAAKEYEVFFFEEPLPTDELPSLEVSTRECGVNVLVPHVPQHWGESAKERALRELLDGFLAERSLSRYTLWYYTPMALGFTRHLKPTAVVYDCMDELAQFKGAPPSLRAREEELFERADLVFTGGQSLYEAKVDKHPRVYAFPSSVDVPHFEYARHGCHEPADQASLPGPKLGFFGVIDERMDLELMATLASARSHWTFVVLGPVAKIDPQMLPRRSNLYYLGPKAYSELPLYLSGWDVALLPYAHNQATRFVSPTKTPEYLAAGRPVVSTSIRDVVTPYGQLGLVHIADTAEEFLEACEAAREQELNHPDWLARVDEFLSKSSWEKTWNAMNGLLRSITVEKSAEEQACPR